MHVESPASPHNILVTGAGGHFNRILVPWLIEAGHRVRCLDIQPLDYDCECIVGSTADYAVMERAARGSDVVVHAAGLHLLPRGTDAVDHYRAYWETNCTGTQNVFLAALRQGAGKVIFSSSITYYDLRRTGYIDEDFGPGAPSGSIYDLSKVLGEELARFYAAAHGLQVIALRYGDFRDAPSPGPSFLRFRMRREDAAQANRLALDYTPQDGFEAFNILAGTPFRPTDLPALAQRPMEILERYYPGVGSLLEHNGVHWDGTRHVFSIERAQAKLGYRPQYTFESYLRALGYDE